MADWRWCTCALPLNRYLVRIDVPDDLWGKRGVLTAAPVGWDTEPPGQPSVGVGDQWATDRDSVLMMVPSVIVPEEWNILINPGHGEAGRIGATMVKRWQYDLRCI